MMKNDLLNKVEKNIKPLSDKKMSKTDNHDQFQAFSLRLSLGKTISY
jgi:hypothetical protein